MGNLTDQEFYKKILLELGLIYNGMRDTDISSCEQACFSNINEATEQELKQKLHKACELGHYFFAEKNQEAINLYLKLFEQDPDALLTSDDVYHLLDFRVRGVGSDKTIYRGSTPCMLTMDYFDAERATVRRLIQIIGNKCGVEKKGQRLLYYVDGPRSSKTCGEDAMALYTQLIDVVIPKGTMNLYAFSCMMKAKTLYRSSFDGSDSVSRDEKNIKSIRWNASLIHIDQMLTRLKTESTPEDIKIALTRYARDIFFLYLTHPSTTADMWKNLMTIIRLQDRDVQLTIAEKFRTLEDLKTEDNQSCWRLLQSTLEQNPALKMDYYLLALLGKSDEYAKTSREYLGKHLNNKIRANSYNKISEEVLSLYNTLTKLQNRWKKDDKTNAFIETWNTTLIDALNNNESIRETTDILNIAINLLFACTGFGLIMLLIENVARAHKGNYLGLFPMTDNAHKQWASSQAKKLLIELHVDKEQLMTAPPMSMKKDNDNGCSTLMY